MAATVAPVSRTPIPGLPLPDLYARVSRHVPAIEWPASAAARAMTSPDVSARAPDAPLSEAVRMPMRTIRP